MLTAATVSAGMGAEERVFDPQEVIIPADKAVSAARFVSEDGSLIELSPFSLRVCPATGAETAVVPAQEPAGGDTPEIVLFQMDPGSLSNLVIEMKDGEEFTVLDAGKLDNTMYMCGGVGEGFQDTSMALNRLVDPEAVKCIRVNGTMYMPEE